MQHARNGRNLQAYRRRARRLKRTVPPVCWICGDMIDLDLPFTHAMSWTADHVVPLAKGGDIHGEMRPAHRRCNSVRQTGDRDHLTQPSPTSREW